MSKTKFSETKVGKFLQKIGSSIIDKAEDVLPDSGFYGILKNLISKDNNLTPKDKETALKLLEMDVLI